MAGVSWPPEIGDGLPRAADAWYAEQKWTDWILAEGGHAQEWSRVFHVSLDDRDEVWAAIAAASVGAPIDTIRDTPGGLTCTLLAEISLGERAARVRIVWHYSGEDAAPRLVTAYPTL